MTDHPSTPTPAPSPAHPFARPGQVAPDRPPRDACVECGQPEAAHRQPRSRAWHVLIHGDTDTTSYVIHAENEIVAAARAGSEHGENDLGRIEAADVGPWDGEDGEDVPSFGGGGGSL